MKLSNNSLSFIVTYVLPKLSFNEVTEDNLSAIVDYIVENFEIPLAQAKEYGEEIDEQLLKIASAVVTEITTNPEW